MEENKYNLTFSDGALQQLKDLATHLGIPESELHKVVGKGLKLLQVAKASKLYKEDPDGKRYLINVKEI
ncbi:MAG: hypothetical protein A2751_04625 [Candidatus Doudnabacteria bacterium RIFCSPHIGHO2_01_FULL_46_14]|uniref:Uncharacterized protein n=1 Tax=Candidatus Doudnabacteria bacterium RIFCSPHIGHO2_01_FULL_46_14 TaxID=1817824 RepID=A0A1F5NNI5_9BACT|nr:MAG: hypothetical protein A2751_04625 [Candidatus Doudnabacteria bacterium RIFCSPHIGHO2_01_FULL_46_14]